MAFTNLKELFNFIVLVVVIAYILSGYIRSPKKTLKQLSKRTFFDWEDFKFAAIISVPAILFHELAHKFSAIFLGVNATFQIFPLGILLGIFLRLIYSPFLLLAPGYVELSESVLSPQQVAIISFSGPFINLLLWIIPALVLKFKKDVSRTNKIILFYTSLLNMWLFIFNMLPFPPLDGSKVFYGLLRTIFS